MSIFNKLHIGLNVLKILKIRLIYKIKVPFNNTIDSNVIMKCNYGGNIIVGENNEFKDGVILMTYGGSITIGNNCSINPYAILYGHGKGLKIGNNVLIAGHTMIIPANHIFDDSTNPINSQGIRSKGIEIKDDVWIGAGCKILDGVTIESGSIIAAGSIVNKNVPEFSVYGGIPSKLIKKRKK